LTAALSNQPDCWPDTAAVKVILRPSPVRSASRNCAESSNAPSSRPDPWGCLGRPVSCGGGQTGEPRRDARRGSI
jgi:hypothetical protein